MFDNTYYVHTILGIQEVRIISVNGNLDSLKKSVIEELEAVCQMQIDKNDFVPPELTDAISDISGRINREISVFIDRKGNIVDLSVGDSSTVALPEVEGRRDKSRLSGVRCIHTHPNGAGMVSLVDINSMLKLRLDAMVAVGVMDGKITEIFVAIPQKSDGGEFNKSQVYGPFKAHDNRFVELWNLIEELDRTAGDTLYANKADAERAILVALETSTGNIVNGKSIGERSLDELEELVWTAGAKVVKKILQRRQGIDSAYYIGRGKLEELCLIRQALDIDLIVFDDELSGAQLRNIEELVGIKVIDRTTLILDIFAQRARSKEGKLQVELAQLKYRVSRLIGLGNQLSRLGGGIGTRGPGEKKLEVDRRHIRRRISYLESELSEVEKRRGFMRKSRDRDSLPVVALVGYTNAGKSTLMNTLCKSDVLAEDKLFATLDPTARNLKLPNGREALLIDTVGFIRKLPHELIESFKSTLEEAVYADVLIHVVDVTSYEAQEQIEVVDNILNALGASSKPIVMALNKVDMLEERKRAPILNPMGKVIEISAVTKEGFEDLLKAITDVLGQDEEELELLIPYHEGWAISYIYKNGKIISQSHEESGTFLKVSMLKSKVDSLKKFKV
ncbi:GTPase HflX [Acetivibrio cellulolyticus]|uniref:GTPase HflX n=1 Tax=Acetivibrio cellulolyticus TaxID=35830 RepID=UPI0001E2D92D|nr:GTPase HflX [Acetivibrio cellulolyticus]